MQHTSDNIEGYSRCPQGADWKPASWTANFLDNLWIDLLAALRSIRRSVGFSATVVLMLTLTIGGTTGVFSFVNAIVLKRLPVPDPERLAMLSYRPHGDNKFVNGYSYPAYRAMATQDQAFDGILARGVRPVELSTATPLGTINCELVSDNYFQVLGVQALMGRLTLSVGEAQFNPAVISHRLWREHFAADPLVLGRVIRLDGHPFQIIGVTERGFQGSVLGQSSDIQVPVESAPLFGNPSILSRNIWLQVMGRLKPGVSFAQAEAITRAITPRIVENVEGRHPAEYMLQDGSRGFPDARKWLASPSLVLMAAIGILLFISCTNIAGLLSSRAIERRHETAVRLALGAPRGRLIRQALIESIMLGVSGGLFGLLFADQMIALL
jgi:putative ABC transport system permease protein